MVAKEIATTLLSFFGLQHGTLVKSVTDQLDSKTDSLNSETDSLDSKTDSLDSKTDPLDLNPSFKFLEKPFLFNLKCISDL